MAYDPRDDERRCINEEQRIEEQRRRQNIGVDNNGAIWVGPNQNEKLLVVQNTAGNSSPNPTNVEQGQEVTVHGVIERARSGSDAERMESLSFGRTECRTNRYLRPGPGRYASSTADSIVIRCNLR